MPAKNKEATENEDTKGISSSVVYNAFNSESTNMTAIDLMNSDQLPEYKPENQNESMRLGGDKVELTKNAIDGIQQDPELFTNDGKLKNKTPPEFSLDDIKMLKFHPFTYAIPFPNKEEQDSIADDVQANGFIEPITIIDDLVIDGCIRVNLLKEGKITRTPSFVQYDGEEANIPDFIMSKKIQRSHLSKGQRAAISLKFYDILKDKNNVLISQRMKWLRSSLDSENENEKIDSRSEAAKYFGISPSYIGKAMKVKAVDSHLFQQVFEGVISLEKAYNQINNSENVYNYKDKQKDSIETLLDIFKKKAEASRTKDAKTNRDKKRTGVNIDSNKNGDRLEPIADNFRSKSETKMVGAAATNQIDDNPEMNTDKNKPEDFLEPVLDGFESEYGVNKIVVSETISLLTKLGIHPHTAQKTILHRIKKELEKKEKWSKQSDDVKFKKYLMDFMGFVRRHLSDDKKYKKFEARIEGIQTDKTFVQLDERIGKLKRVCSDDEKKFLDNSITAVNISMSEIPDSEKFQTIITKFVELVSGELNDK